MKGERVEDRPNKSSKGARSMFGQASSQRFITGELSVLGKRKQRNKNENREVIRDGEIIGRDKRGGVWENRTKNIEIE